MGERSFAEDVKQLGYGEGQFLRGEGILAITKALLQSGVSYVGGYPGSPISHLLDVMADANESLLKPMGIYYELSGRCGGCTCSAWRMCTAARRCHSWSSTPSTRSCPRS